MFFTSLYFSILLRSLIIFSHPVHVSVTNVDYKKDVNKIEVSFKVFKQDMQLLFVHLNQININFDDLEKVKLNQNRINNYFDNHFKIKNGLELMLTFRESKLDNEWIWFYYEAEVKELKEEIEISNTILLDLYFDQKNMMIFCVDEKEKGYMFNMKKTTQRINLNEL